METIHYPVKGRKLEQFVSQHTFDMLISGLLDWQQGPGGFGRLHLHPCWSVSSVLDKGYAGETTYCFYEQMSIFRRLYEKTKDPKWLITENALAAHLLYLQDPEGGFIHATNRA